MTATYSEEGLDKTAPLDLTRIRNSAINRESKYIEASWTHLETPAEALPSPDTCVALDAIDWAEIDEESSVTTHIEFLHASETEFARMLDARDITWRYKPRTFAVEWDEEGNFIDCFTPDFFLPDYEMYVVLIAPYRSVPDGKTKRVKLLRRQHPEIRIEVLDSAHTHCRFETVY